jgi:hypothetical protein
MGTHAQVIVATPVDCGALNTFVILVVKIGEVLCTFIHFQKMAIGTLLFKAIQFLLKYVVIVGHVVLFFGTRITGFEQMDTDLFCFAKYPAIKLNHVQLLMGATTLPFIHIL